MSKLTMAQIARANNFAIAYNLDSHDLVEALQSALNLAEILAIPRDVIEDFIYGVLRDA